MIIGKFHCSHDAPIKDKAGKVLMTPKEQERWAEHFREVLNRPSPSEEADIRKAVQDLDITVAPRKKKK